MSEWENIQTFRKHFKMPMYDVPTFDGARLEERKVYLFEEVRELTAAIADGDMIEVADALVDLVYIIKGTAASLGMNWPALWQTVHASNMAKVRADTVDESKRGIIGDVYKPNGWTPPDIATALLLPRTHVQPKTYDSILAEAADIMDNRGQERQRAYGPMQKSIADAGLFASTMSRRPLSADDVLCAIIGIKMSREKHAHKRDNLLDAVAYMSALNDLREVSE